MANQAEPSSADVPPVDSRVDESFRSILEGLRTTLPGVQVLFTFLLILPFQSGFSDLAGIELASYYVAFLSAAVSSVLLIAPSAHQRLRAPLTGVARRSKSHLAVAVRLTIVGTVTSAVALAASVFLISTVVFDHAVGYVAAGAVSVLAAWTWFYEPLVSFRRRP